MCLGLLFLGVACQSVRVVKQEAAEQFSLASYKTFDFYPEDNGAKDTLSQESILDMKILKKEVEQHLTARGLVKSPQEPDVWVNLGMVIVEKDQTRETIFGRDAPYYLGQRRYSWKSQEVKVGQYKEGTISLHLVDRRNNELGWQGEAETVIPKKPASSEERIKEGVAALFKRIK